MRDEAELVAAYSVMRNPNCPWLHRSVRFLQDVIHTDVCDMFQAWSYSEHLLSMVYHPHYIALVNTAIKV